MFRNPGSRARAGRVPAAGFAAGTRSPFQQTSAPLGWTKDTSFNDYAPRIVTGSVTSGGTSNFSTVFGLTTTDAVALTPGQMCDNTVTANTRTTGSGSTVVTASHNGGTSAGHSHGIELRVKFVDFIIAVKS